jgi:hypothetical protein
MLGKCDDCFNRLDRRLLRSREAVAPREGLELLAHDVIGAARSAADERRYN